MTSTLKDKIIYELSSSSSINYVEENTLALLDKKEDVINALEQLVKDLKILCCNITKNGRSFNVYWLSILVAQKKLKQHSALFRTKVKKNISRPKIKNEKIKIKKELPCTTHYEKTLPDRWCRACEKKHLATDFANSRSRRCISSTIIYNRNKSDILNEKARKWREKKKQINQTAQSKIS
ncbi:MAG: hypothetical protein ABIR84_03755 [Candidatus Nitrotoga sp.]